MADCKVEYHTIPKTIKEALHYSDEHCGVSMKLMKGLKRNGKQMYELDTGDSDDRVELLTEKEVFDYALERWCDGGELSDEVNEERRKLEVAKYYTKKRRFRPNWRKIE